MTKARELQAEADHLRILASNQTDVTTRGAIQDLIVELEDRAKALLIRTSDGHGTS